MTYLACFQKDAKKTTEQCSLLYHQLINQNDVYHKINDVTNVSVYSRLKQDYIKKNSCKQLQDCYLNLHLKFGAILSKTHKDMILYLHRYQDVHSNLLQKNFSIQEWLLYKGL